MYSVECTTVSSGGSVHIHYLAGVGSKSPAWTGPHVTAFALALLTHMFTLARSPTGLLADFYPSPFSSHAFTSTYAF